METERDDTVISDKLSKLCTFYEKCVAPEILMRRLENESAGACITGFGCVVVQVQTGLGWPTITCNEPLCSIKWFHVSCLNLKRRLTGAWYCPTCRKGRKQL